jgi:uncharacterized SAM-binding protein YcdF (DUF218 family)
MADSLQHDFGIKNVWLEDRSQTTAENALFTARLLKTKRINSVLLVTHAYHMPRALRMFEQSGLNVVPAPTVLSVERDSNEPLIISLLPSASAFTALMSHSMSWWVWCGTPCVIEFRHAGVGTTDSRQAKR